MRCSTRSSPTRSGPGRTRRRTLAERVVRAALQNSGAMSFIELEGVAKTFEVDDGEIQALRSVSLGIEQGEFVSLVGPSGCGKSTLLRILAGLISPTDGEVRVAGEAVRAPRSDVGIVFQNAVLLPWRTVIDNVMLPVDVAGEDRDAYRTR